MIKFFVFALVNPRTLVLKVILLLSCEHQRVAGYSECANLFKLGKGAKKKKEKNLTSVSFAFTHTYTPVKTNIFPLFPQAYMENFEKCAKTGNMGTLGGGGGANSPL